jgi:hypothetical protein
MAWEDEYIAYTVSNLPSKAPQGLQFFSIAEKRRVL